MSFKGVGRKCLTGFVKYDYTLNCGRFAPIFLSPAEAAVFKKKFNPFGPFSIFFFIFKLVDFLTVYKRTNLHYFRVRFRLKRLGMPNKLSKYCLSSNISVLIVFIWLDH